MNQGRRKILYLITKGTWGGAQKYVFDLATHLSRGEFSAKGKSVPDWDVTVAYGTEGKLPKALTNAGVRTLHLPSLARDVSISSDLKSLLEIARCIRSERPDVLHLNSSKAAALGALAGWLCGVKKILFTVHGWPFREDRGTLGRAMIWLISWFTALLSSNVICVCEFDLAQAKSMPFIAKRSVRIYNGIDLAMHFGSGDIVRAKFPAGANITGTIGELTKNKNQRALIEEAKTDTSLYVAIVGEGEEHSSLASLIRIYDLGERVQLLGFIPAQDALRGFDTFVLPSVKEGLPYVLIEAKLAGVPVIANRVGGVGEILDANDMREFSIDRMIEQTIAIL